MVPFRQARTREKPQQFFSVSEHSNWMSQNTKSIFVNAQVTVVWCPPPPAGLITPLCLMSALWTKTPFLTGLAIFLSLTSPALPTEFLPASMYVLQWQDNVHEMHHTDIFEQCRHSVSLWPQLHLRALLSTFSHGACTSWNILASVRTAREDSCLKESAPCLKKKGSFSLFKLVERWVALIWQWVRLQETQISPPQSEYCALITSH